MTYRCLTLLLNPLIASDFCQKNFCYVDNINFVFIYESQLRPENIARESGWPAGRVGLGRVDAVLVKIKKCLLLYAVYYIK